MDKKTIQIKTSKTIEKSLTIMKGIFPFTEKPSLDRSCDPTEGLSEGLCAADLFSLFTADVIKQKVIFTR